MEGLKMIKGSIERLEELDREMLEIQYERDGALAKLQESEHRYRALSEAGFEAIAIHRTGKVLTANDAFEELVGYTEEEIEENPALMFDIIAPGLRDEVKQRIDKKDMSPYRCKFIHKDGTILDVYIRPKYVQYNGSGRCRAAVVTLWETKIHGE